jgi:hypothetical protein
MRQYGERDDRDERLNTTTTNQREAAGKGSSSSAEKRDTCERMGQGAGTVNGNGCRARVRDWRKKSLFFWRSMGKKEETECS